MSQPDRIQQEGQLSNTAQQVVKELSQRANLEPRTATSLLRASEERIDQLIETEVTQHPYIEDLGYDRPTLSGTETHYRQLLTEKRITKDEFAQLMENLGPQLAFAQQREQEQARLLRQHQQEQAIRRSRRWLPVKVGLGLGYGLILLTTFHGVTSTQATYEAFEKELKATTEYARVTQLDRSAASLSAAGGLLEYSPSKRENDKNIPEKFPNPGYAKKQMGDALAEMGDLGETDDLVRLIKDSLPDVNGELKIYGNDKVNASTFQTQKDDIDKVKKQIKSAQEEVKLSNPQPWNNLNNVEQERVWAWLKFGISAIPAGYLFLRKLGQRM